MPKDVEIVGYIVPLIGAVLGICLATLINTQEKTSTAQDLSYNCPPPGTGYDGSFDKYLCQGMIYIEAEEAYPSLSSFPDSEGYTTTGVLVGGDIIGYSPAYVASADIAISVTLNKAFDKAAIWTFKLEAGILKDEDKEAELGDGQEVLHDNDKYKEDNETKLVKDEDITFYQTKTWNQLVDCTKLDSKNSCSITIGTVHTERAVATYYRLSVILLGDESGYPIGLNSESFPIKFSFDVSYNDASIVTNRVRFIMSIILLLCAICSSALGLSMKVPSNSIALGLCWVVVLGILCPLSYVKEIIWDSTIGDGSIDINASSSGLNSSAIEMAISFCEAVGDAFILSLAIWYCADALWISLGGHKPMGAQRPKLLSKCSPPRCLAVATVIGILYLIISAFALSGLTGGISKALGITMSILSIVVCAIVLCILGTFVFLWIKYSGAPSSGLIDSGHDVAETDKRNDEPSRESENSRDMGQSSSTTALSDRVLDELNTKGGAQAGQEGLCSMVIVLVLAACVLVHSIRYFNTSLYDHINMFAIGAMPVCAGGLAVVEKLLGNTK